MCGITYAKSDTTCCYGAIYMLTAVKEQIEDKTTSLLVQIDNLYEF